MKTPVVALALASLLTAPSAVAQTPAPATTVVTLTLENVRHRDGVLRAELRTENAWSRGKRFMGVEMATPAKGPVVLQFKDVPPGRYAVRLFQDRNSDGELQTNFVGLPSEPWGMSNNPSLMRGAPTFAAAAFDVGAGGAALTIRLR
jgi:uncharacterized protein (DUF2141 family)